VNVFNSGDWKFDRAYNVSEMCKLDKKEDVKFTGYAGPISESGE
jgi:hypothetical protein